MGGDNSGGRAGWRSETGSLPKIQGVNASAAGFRPCHGTVAELGEHGSVILARFAAFVVVFCLINVPEIG
jgi:hypothetical protein